MKRITIIALLLFSLVNGLKATPTIMNLFTVETVNGYDFIILRSVVLHPEGTNMANYISANLIIKDGKEMIEYKGILYEISQTSNNSKYDSCVSIDGVRFLFRKKIRPYE